MAKSYHAINPVRLPLCGGKIAPSALRPAALSGTQMNETDFLRLTSETLTRIEQGLEDAGLDFETPADGILEIEFDDGSKMIVNRHNVAQEIWVAARSGGFHFQHDGRSWHDTRDSTELFAKLTTLIAVQSGETISFK